MNGHAATMLKSKLTDETRDTVEAARSGSEAGWQQLFEAHYPKLLRYFRSRVASTDVAEDLAAETFAEAFRSIGTFRWRNRPFEAWLFGIARHRLLMHFRSRRPTTALHDGIPSRVDDFLSVQVRDALARLPADYREAIELRYVVGLDGVEAAAAMGRSHGAFRALLMRATRAFKREYGAV